MLLNLENLLGSTKPPPNPLRLKHGDVVRLKSGGPEMAVSAIARSGLVQCVWFDDENHMHAARISPHLLETANKKKKPSGKRR